MSSRKGHQAESQTLQQRLEHLYAVLRAIRSVNQLAVREKDADRLAREACRLLVETQCFNSAWLARLDDDGNLRLVAEAGLGDAARSFAERLRGGNLVQCARTALGVTGVHVVLDPLKQCLDCPLPQGYGGRSSMTVRLEHQDTVFGLLGLSVPREYVEDDEEIVLFRELADDIASALSSIRDADLHEQAVEQLQQEQALTTSLLETSPSAIVVVDSHGAIESANAEAERVLGLAKDLITQRDYNDPAWHIVDHEGNPFPDDQLPVSRVLLEGRAVHGVEHAIEWPTGERVLLSVNAAPLWSQSGEIAHVVCTIEDVTEQRHAKATLRESESRVRRKLDAVLQPEGDIASLELADVLDTPAIQALMDDFYSLTTIGVAVVDLQGNVLVSTGWQDVCTKFHRVHPETAQNCTESDLMLSRGVEPGTFKRYRCKNMMWDMATPLIVGGMKLGNIYLGQFFFDDEVVDIEAFRAQARKYDFDEEEYLAAVERVPRWSHTMVDAAMEFYSRLAAMIANSGYGTVKLACALAERDATLQSLSRSEQRFRRLFDSMMSGFVLLEAIFDDEGEPVNFRFLQANPAFERLSGLKASDTVGRTLFEVSPGAESFWPEIYGGVAISGEPVEFERYSERLGKHLRIAAYSPEPGKVAGLVEDITGSKKAEEETRLLATFPAENPNPVLRADEQGLIVFANEASAPLLNTWGTGVGDGLPAEWQARSKAARDAGSELHAEAVCGERVFEIAVAPLKERGGVNLYGLDVTERRRAEQALRESEEKFRSLFEQSMDAIFIIASDGSGLEANQAGLDLFGYRRDELRDLDVSALYADEMKREDSLRRMTETGHVEDEVRLKKKDGTVMDCHLTVVLRKDEHGNVIGSQGIVRDITEDKRRKDALADELSRRRILLEQSRDGIVVLDEDGKVAEANLSFAQMLGYSPEELHQLHLWDWDASFPPETLTEMLRTVDESGDHFETRHRRKDGTVYDVEISTNGAVFAGRKLVFCVCRDITEQKRAQEELRSSEERYRLLIQNQTDTIVKVDISGRFEFVSPSYCRMFGKTEDELLGRTFMPLVHPDDRDATARAMEDLYRPPYSALVEQRAMTTDGWRWLGWVDTAVLDADSNVVSIIGVGRDITARKEAEQALLESREELRRLATRVEEAREDERTNLARELHDTAGQAITALKLDVGQLKKRLERGHVPTPEELDALNSLLDVTADDVRRISSELRPGVLDDIGLVGAIEWQTDELRKRTALDFTVSLPCEQFQLDYARRTTIFRVFQELLTNTVRHAAARSVRVTLERTGDVCTLTVADDGRGVDLEKLEASSSIGIIGMRERLKPYGGELHYDIMPGEGTTARVVMPVV